MLEHDVPCFVVHSFGADTPLVHISHRSLQFSCVFFALLLLFLLRSTATLLCYPWS